MDHICLNGKIMPGDEPLLLAANRGYRYGDGLFETLKVVDNRILLASYHFKRLFEGLTLLKFPVPTLFTAEKLQQEILHLCKRNECEGLARVRLSVSRGDGGLYEEGKGLYCLIESWPLEASVNSLNTNGLVIDIYPLARKSCDAFSNLKSANFLPYVMAAKYAKENKLNDCLLLNTHERICDATIANVFIISGGKIITPSLEEGCVNGVMRRRILDCRLQISELGLQVQETSLTKTDILDAEEIFLTNAIHGIRWVKQFRDKTYANSKTMAIYDRLISIIP